MYAIPNLRGRIVHNKPKKYNKEQFMRLILAIAVLMLYTLFHVGVEYFTKVNL